MQPSERKAHAPAISRLPVWVQSHSDALLLAAIVCCGAFWLAIEQNVTDCSRRTLIIEQSQKVRIIAAALETRLGMTLSQAAIMARYDLGEHFQGQGAIASIVDHLQAGLAAYPDVIAYTLVDTGGELVYAQGVESEAGDKSVNYSLAWAKRIRLDAATPPDAVSLTVLSPAGSPALLGALFSVRLRDEIVGALIVAIDIHRAAEQVFGPTGDSVPGSLSIIEPQGTVIQLAGRKDAGAPLTGLSREDFHDLLDRAGGAQAGSALYSQAGGISGLLQPKLLVSWQIITVGPRSFIVCRTVPMRRLLKYDINF